MAKIKSAFFCSNCGSQHSKWQGQCKGCKEWNTLNEEILEKKPQENWIGKTGGNSKITSVKISEIHGQGEQRISSGNKELNRVLGGGIVLGSVILIGGEPGIGKSTLMLQVALSVKNLKVLYVSGEESSTQIKLRAERVGLQDSDCYILTETNTQKIFEQAQRIEPNIIIIDSIQTLHTQYIESSAGSISQIKECATELIKYAKKTETPIFLIGHITKDGHIAGPKILEHMVDTVLHFEGDRNHLFRILRANKNRFGSTQELALFEMSSRGLREVHNPSEVLVTRHSGDLSGNAIAVTVDGMRSMLVEIQALVSSSVYGTPQRSSTGYDTKRLNMLLAVLEKRCGFRLASKDVFLNITGGIKLDDPGIDLAVVCAILSSNDDIAVPHNSCFAAEVGLNGEIRPVSKVEQRIKEAEKLGYDVIFISEYNKLEKKNYKIIVKPLAKIEELYKTLF